MGRPSVFHLRLVGVDSARCSRCDEVKPLLNWPKAQDQRRIKYRLSYCQDCRRQQITDWANRDIETNIRMRHGRLRFRARKAGILCSITADEFVAQWHRQGGCCFYTDVPLAFLTGRGKADNSASVDRAIPLNGYVDGNVVFASNRVNTIKRDMTMDEMRDWTPGWHSRIIEMYRERGITCCQVAEGNF